MAAGVLRQVGRALDRARPALRRLDAADERHRPTAERQRAARRGHREALRRRRPAHHRHHRAARRRRPARGRPRPAHRGTGQLQPASAGTGPTGSSSRASASCESRRGEVPREPAVDQGHRAASSASPGPVPVRATSCWRRSPARTGRSSAAGLVRRQPARAAAAPGRSRSISQARRRGPARQRAGRGPQARRRRVRGGDEHRGGVGGPAGSLGDFRSETASRICPSSSASRVVVALLLMVLLRAVVLPLVAVAFDLLTAAATFGDPDAAVQRRRPAARRPGLPRPDVDHRGVRGASSAMTMVYEVQLLHRTGEAFLDTGDPHGALRTGLRQTAAAGTGAAIAHDRGDRAVRGARELIAVRAARRRRWPSRSCSTPHRAGRCCCPRPSRSSAAGAGGRPRGRAPSAGDAGAAVRGPTRRAARTPTAGSPA